MVENLYMIAYKDEKGRISIKYVHSDEKYKMIFSDEYNHWELLDEKNCVVDYDQFRYDLAERHKLKLVFY